MCFSSPRQLWMSLEWLKWLHLSRTCCHDWHQSWKTGQSSFPSVVQQYLVRNMCHTYGLTIHILQKHAVCSCVAGCVCVCVPFISKECMRTNNAFLLALVGSEGEWWWDSTVATNWGFWSPTPSLLDYTHQWLQCFAGSRDGHVTVWWSCDVTWLLAYDCGVKGHCVDQLLY